jgi:hypothetical protein
MTRCYGDKICFTIRDWFWLCLVLFLAMGWGSHFGYSQFVATHSLNNEWKVDADQDLQNLLI